MFGINTLRQAPAGTYQLRAENSQTTYAQVEIDISYTDLVSHLPDTDEWSAIAPIRICSFDIECAGRKGIFPEAEIDPVIQIANAITVQGETTPRFKNVFVLNSCAPISGAKVYSFETERELLQAWALFVQVGWDGDVWIVGGGFFLVFVGWLLWWWCPWRALPE